MEYPWSKGAEQTFALVYETSRSRPAPASEWTGYGRRAPHFNEWMTILEGIGL